MSSLRLYLIYICGLLSLVACHDRLELPEEEPEATPSQRVVIVYMMAENSLSRYTQPDLNEMLLASGQIPSDCRLVVYHDNALRPVIYTLGHGEEEFTTWREYKEDLVSTDSAQFASTLSTIVRAFPAEHYGLVMWSHGSGWIPAPRRTIGVDNNRNSPSLNTGTELEIQAMHGALQGIGLHLDYILWDACFMQSIEVAHTLRQDADWLIGSSAEIPAQGAPYTDIMTALCQGDAQGMVEGYYHYYESSLGVTLSAIRCSELDRLAYETSRLSASLYREGAPTEGIQTYCAYGLVSGWKPEYYDLGSAASQLLPVDLYSQWAQSLDAAVPYRRSSDTWATSYGALYSPLLTDALHSVGVSMFLPDAKYESRGYNQAFYRTSWWQAVGTK